VASKCGQLFNWAATIACDRQTGTEEVSAAVNVVLANMDRENIGGSFYRSELAEISTDPKQFLVVGHNGALLATIHDHIEIGSLARASHY
jgi:hypothetical protein